MKTGKTSTIAQHRNSNLNAKALSDFPPPPVDSVVEVDTAQRDAPQSGTDRRHMLHNSLALVADMPMALAIAKVAGSSRIVPKVLLAVAE